MVDISANPIQSFSTNGICLSDQEYDLDLIVMAIGFGTMTGTLMKIDISGRGELGLKEK